MPRTGRFLMVLIIGASALLHLPQVHGEEETNSPALREVLVVPADSATARDLQDALAEIRKSVRSPAERIARIDELFALNREILFRKVESSPARSAAALRNAATRAGEAAEKLAESRDGSPEAERAVLQADVRTAHLEALAAGRTPAERIGLVDALFRENAAIIAEALNIPQRSSSSRPSAAELEARIASWEAAAQTPEEKQAVQLRAAHLRIMLSPGSPEARIAAMDEFLAAHEAALDAPATTHPTTNNSTPPQ